jgi:hypothetical protein
LVEVVDNLQKRIEKTDNRSSYRELRNYRDYIQEGLYTLKDVNDYSTFKEKLALIDMQGVLAITDKIIKEKEKEHKENEKDKESGNEF